MKHKLQTKVAAVAGLAFCVLAVCGCQPDDPSVYVEKTRTYTGTLTAMSTTHQALFGSEAQTSLGAGPSVDISITVKPTRLARIDTTAIFSRSRMYSNGTIAESCKYQVSDSYWTEGPYAYGTFLFSKESILSNNYEYTFSGTFDEETASGEIKLVAVQSTTAGPIRMTVRAAFVADRQE